MPTYKKRSKLGSIRPKHKQFQARYMRHGVMHHAGQTFSTPKLADDWLLDEERLIDRGEWTPPADRRKAQEAAHHASTLTLEAFAREWIEHRTTPRGKPLSERTKYEYERYLVGRLSDLAALPLVEITRKRIDTWWKANEDAPTMRHHIYAFLLSVMDDAADNELIPANPCKVKNAARRTRQRSLAEVNELITRLTHVNVATLAEAMPARHQAFISLLAYSGLRPQEAFGLTRQDIIIDPAVNDVPRYSVRVNKAVSRGKIAPTKTPESNRIVPLPPHLAAILDEHLQEHAAPGADGLVFPSTHDGQAFGTLHQVMGSYASSKDSRLTGFNAARAAIGRPDLRIYDLRRWARHTWRSAGISELEAEHLLGHKLADVTSAYFTLDNEALWPYMERISEAAGWKLPTSEFAPTPAAAIDTRVIAAMTPEQLRTILPRITDDQLAAIVPLLPPETVAALIHS